MVRMPRSSGFDSTLRTADGVWWRHSTGTRRLSDERAA